MSSFETPGGGSPPNTGTIVTSTTQAPDAGPPGPTQSGIVSNCNKYTVVQAGGSCAAIESQYGITFAQFFGWNPAVGSNCENLWIGEAYCVGVSSGGAKRRHIQDHAMKLAAMAH